MFHTQLSVRRKDLQYNETMFLLLLSILKLRNVNICVGHSQPNSISGTGENSICFTFALDKKHSFRRELCRAYAESERAGIELGALKFQREHTTD